MTKKSNKRDHLLQQGVEMLTQVGLEGITLGGLSEQAGVSKSGLFAHFGSKEELQIALLEHTAQIAGVYVVEPAMGEPQGLPRLKAVIRNWFGWTERAGLPGGCPVAAALFEQDDIEGPIRDKVIEMESYWRDCLSQLVRQAVDQGHLRPALDSEQFVWELCGLYLSHHVSFRFLREPNATPRAMQAVDALLERAGANPD